MKLSEAIRLGAMMGKQLYGTTLDGDDSCALGSSLLAIGKRGIYVDVWGIFPMAGQYAINPRNGERRMVLSIIRELNDSAEWTRERIADWVATLEPQEETVQEVAETVELVGSA